MFLGILIFVGLKLHFISVHNNIIDHVIYELKVNIQCVSYELNVTYISGALWTENAENLSSLLGHVCNVFSPCMYLRLLVTVYR